MKAIEWIKKFTGKLLGGKVNTPGAGESPGVLAIVIPIAPGKKKVSRVLDGLGVIRLPEHWRN
jgi:hypothetical protein